MISWLIIILLAYFFLGLSFFGDKLILNGKPNAQLYVFYVGCLNILMALLLPFAGFALPGRAVFPWILFEPVVFMGGLLAMFAALERLEVSRAIPVIGALQPIGILLLTAVFWDGQAVTGVNFLAFALLLLGSVVITLQKGFSVNGRYLWLLILAALLFALDYVVTKIIFQHGPFLSGLIWMRLFSVPLALLLLFGRRLRKKLRAKQTKRRRRDGIIFLVTQVSGGAANILQSFAIFLAPVGSLAIMNALSGTQYVFLFILTALFSLFFPRLLKEDVSRRAILQKVCAIILIIAGLAVLVA